MPNDLYQLIQAASRRAEVRDAVRDIYTRLQARVDEREPLCSASGRCCKFDEYGHRLYVTTVELATFIYELKNNSTVTWASGPCEPHQGLPLFPQPIPTPGGCPFQLGKLCGVHTIRPFGCRVFFCDPSAADWQQQQYEEYHAELKQLHDRFDIPYFYMEWRQALSLLELR